jgi:hypothetical protein
LAVGEKNSGIIDRAIGGKKIPCQQARETKGGVIPLANSDTRYKPWRAPIQYASEVVLVLTQQYFAMPDLSLV